MVHPFDGFNNLCVQLLSSLLRWSGNPIGSLHKPLHEVYCNFIAVGNNPAATIKGADEAP